MIEENESDANVPEESAEIEIIEKAEKPKKEKD